MATKKEVYVVQSLDGSFATVTGVFVSLEKSLHSLAQPVVDLKRESAATFVATDSDGKLFFIGKNVLQK